MRVVFLDRDNTLNENGGHTWRNLRPLPKVVHALKKLNDAGSIVIVVSNQAGIAYGCYTREDMLKETYRFFARLSPAKVDAYFYCPHHPNVGCGCRKPRSGLFTRAIEQLGLDTDDMWVVGDKESDMIAGETVGCKGIMIGRDVADLSEAVERILDVRS